MAQRREDEECYRVEDEDNPERDGHLVLVGLEDRPYGRYRASAADCRPGGNQIRRLLLNPHITAKHNAYHHDSDHGNHREQHPVCPRLERLLQVHAEAEAHHGSLQQIFGKLLVELRERYPEDESENQADEKSDGRSDERFPFAEYGVERHAHQSQKHPIEPASSLRDRALG
jgi:hypothetical protein